MSHALPREWFGGSIRNDGLRREKARLRAGSILLYLAAVSLPVAALLFYILQGVQVIRTGYEIDQLRDTLQALRAERDSLEVELASLQNLDSVEKIATRDLGMVRPRTDQVVAVRLEETARGAATAPVGEAADGGAAEEPRENTFVLFLRRLSGAL